MSEIHHKEDMTAENILPGAKKEKKALYFDMVMMALLAAFFIYMQSLYLNLDSSYPQGNAQGYMNRSIYTWLALQDYPLKFYFPALDYPSLVFVISSLFYFIFGFSIKTAYMSSVAFIVILIPALYFLGRYFGIRILSWIMIFTIMGNHYVLFNSRTYNLDFPVFALATLGYLLYFLAEDFRSSKYSVLFGLALGIGMLAKFILPFFIIPLVYSGLVIIHSEFNAGQRRWLYASLAVFVTAAYLLFRWIYTSGKFLIRPDGIFHIRPVIIRYILDNYILLSLIFMFFAWLLIILIRKLISDRKIRLKNYFTALLIAFGLGVPAFLIMLDKFVFLTSYHEQLYRQNGLLMYLGDIFNVNFNHLRHFFPLAPLFIAAGAVYSLFRIKEMKYQKLLAAAFGTFILLVILEKDPEFRYIMSLMGILVLLAFCWIRKVPSFIRVVILVLSGYWFITGVMGWTPSASRLQRYWMARPPVIIEICVPGGRYRMEAGILKDIAAQVKERIIKHGGKVRNIRFMYLSMLSGTNLEGKTKVVKHGRDIKNIKSIYRGRVPEVNLRDLDLEIFLATNGVIPGMLRKPIAPEILRNDIKIITYHDPSELYRHILNRLNPDEINFIIVSRYKKEGTTPGIFKYGEIGSMKLLKEYKLTFSENEEVKPYLQLYELEPWK